MAMKVVVAKGEALEMDIHNWGRVEDRVRGKNGGGASTGNDGCGACFWKKGREVTAIQAMVMSVAVMAFVG